jgi:glyoxylase-like metal-dependent hydrolase (beta-lactamase superfamily II)/ferredoxin
MPKREARNPASAAGDWYIDDRCIDCAASREVAPGLIVHHEGKSVFARQPVTEDETRAAWRALLLCPTASIGKDGPREQPPDLFPQELAPGIYRCGYNARSSFGAHSYFIRRPEGNVLVDSPRYVAKLVEAFERMGGIAEVLLSHQDDVADADKYADKFSARVWIHEEDRSAASYATNLLKGSEITGLGGSLIAIPVPGHTRGSVVYVWRDTYLFSGDSLAWSLESQDLTAFRDACWYSWSELKRSLARLTEYRFEWILPGHGHSVHLPAAEMNARLRTLVDRM